MTPINATNPYKKPITVKDLHAKLYSEDPICATLFFDMHEDLIDCMLDEHFPDSEAPEVQGYWDRVITSKDAELLGKHLARLQTLLIAVV